MFGPYFVNFIVGVGWFVAHEDEPSAIEYGPWKTETEACRFLQNNYKQSSLGH